MLKLSTVFIIEIHTKALTAKFPALIRDSLLLNTGGGVWEKVIPCKSLRCKIYTMSDLKKYAIKETNYNNVMATDKQQKTINHNSA